MLCSGRQSKVWRRGYDLDECGHLKAVWKREGEGRERRTGCGLESGYSRCAGVLWDGGIAGYRWYLTRSSWACIIINVTAASVAYCCPNAVKTSSKFKVSCPTGCFLLRDTSGSSDPGAVTCLSCQGHACPKGMLAERMQNPGRSRGGSPAGCYR